ncbi:MAG: hypothetical protein JWQ38_1955 [Flavipsychrobacter sp.]|nr:hypothetical protein [Flavipsychrobacter sp.]
MKKTILIISVGLFSFLWSCNKEKSISAPVPDNEFLTTIMLVAVNEANPADVDTATWVDLTPDDPNPPDTSKAVLHLHSNSVYDVQVIFLDQTQTPAGDITAELKERQNYHLLFFQPTPIAAADTVSGIDYTAIPGTAPALAGPYLNLKVARTDKDSNVPPQSIGLSDKFTTGAISSGHLEVVLRHQPNAKNGTYAPGSTDADVSYRVNIN